LIEFERDGVRYVPVFNKRDQSTRHIWLGYVPLGSLVDNAEPATINAVNALDGLREPSSSADHIFVLPSAPDQNQGPNPIPCTLAINSQEQPVNYCLCEEVEFITSVHTSLVSGNTEPEWEEVNLYWNYMAGYSKYLIKLQTTTNSPDPIEINSDAISFGVYKDMLHYKVDFLELFDIEILKTEDIHFEIYPLLEESHTEEDALYSYEGEAGRFYYDYHEEDVVDRIITAEETTLGACYDCPSSSSIEEVNPDNYSFEWDSSFISEGCDTDPNCDSRITVSPATSRTYSLNRNNISTSQRSLTPRNPNINVENISLESRTDLANINVQVQNPPLPEPEIDIYFTADLPPVFDGEFDETQEFRDGETMYLSTDLVIANLEAEITLNVDNFDGVETIERWRIAEYYNDNPDAPEVGCSPTSAYQWIGYPYLGNQQNLCHAKIQQFSESKRILEAKVKLDGDVHIIQVIIDVLDLAVIDLLAIDDSKPSRVAHEDETLYYLELSDDETPIEGDRVELTLHDEIITISPGNDYTRKTDYEAKLHPETDDLDDELYWNYFQQPGNEPQESYKDKPYIDDLLVNNHPDYLTDKKFRNKVTESNNNTDAKVDVEWVEYKKVDRDFTKFVLKAAEGIETYTKITKFLSDVCKWIPAPEGLKPAFCDPSKLKIFDWRDFQKNFKIARTQTDLYEDPESRHVIKKERYEFKCDQTYLLNLPDIKLPKFPFPFTSIPVRLIVGGKATFEANIDTENHRRYEDNVVVRSFFNSTSDDNEDDKEGLRGVIAYAGPGNKNIKVEGGFWVPCGMEFIAPYKGDPNKIALRSFIGPSGTPCVYFSVFKKLTGWGMKEPWCMPGDDWIDAYDIHAIYDLSTRLITFE